MNKKIASISLALLFASGAASAQSSVTVYGVVDAGLAYTNGSEAAGKVVALNGNQQSYSRLGFRGTEDLGNNLKAIFLVENEFRLDTGVALAGTPSMAQSQAYIGLISNLGTVKLGRQWTQMYVTHNTLDPFQNGMSGGASMFFGVNGANPAATVYYKYMDNAFTYETPGNLNGFKGAVQYGFGEAAGTFAKDSRVGATIGYENGPLNVAYSYYNVNLDTATSVPAFSSQFLGGSYDFGVLKLHAAIDENKQSGIYKAQDYMIGARVPFGAHTLIGSYTHKKNKLVSDANATRYALGYTYDFSKRTNLYASYSHIKNDARSMTATKVAGNNVNIVQVGLRHKF